MRVGVTPWSVFCCRMVTTQTEWGLLTIDPIAWCSRYHLLWIRDAGSCPRVTAPAAAFPRRGSGRSLLPLTHFSFGVWGMCVWFAVRGSHACTLSAREAGKWVPGTFGFCGGRRALFHKGGRVSRHGEGFLILSNQEEQCVPATAPEDT